MKAKWFAALATLSLASAPVVAQADAPRALAPIAGTPNAMGGESFLPWAILLGIVAGATLLIVNEEDDDNDPISL